MAKAWTLGTQLGVATLQPATGTDDDTLAISTPGACPDAATYAQIVLYGAGFPADGYYISANNPTTILPKNASGGYDSIGTLDNLGNFANVQTPPAIYTGTYTVALVCKKSFGNTDYGDYVSTLTFSDPHHYTTISASVATTTVLSASPPGSAVVGGSVTLTATVTPAGAAGNVQFFDGTTSLGTAAVTNNVATLSTTSLSGATHSLSATFTPTAPAGATPSTSAAVSYVVAVPLPVLSRPSALVLTVGTKFICPDGTKATVPAAAVGVADSCSSGGPYIVGAKGVAPLALINPSLTGTGKVGTKLTLKPGFWTPSYTSRTVVWKRDGKVISTGSSATYKVAKGDKGHKISATVIAHLAGHLDGTASTSPAKAKGIVASATLSSAALTGSTDTTANAKAISVPVGSSVGCVAGAFTGATTTTSAWFIDGVEASHDIALVIGDKAVGHTLVCRTTGTSAGGTVVSDATITMVPGGALVSYVAPRLAGRPNVGKKLLASAGKWYPVYGKATFVWLRNGVAIKGATKAAYTLTSADKKHKISVRVTVTRPGWTTAHASSAAVSVG